MILEFKKDKLQLNSLINCIKKSGQKIVCTSGFYDPIHPGHIRNILTSKKFGDYLIIIVNGDKQAKRKKGKPFMPVSERAYIVNSIKGVDLVVTYDSDTKLTCTEVIKFIKPNVFTKGGDRTSANTPEAIYLKKIGGEVIYGVGTGKRKESSSDYLKDWVKYAG